MQLQNCDLCGKSVQLKDGILSISFPKVREIQDQRADWDKAYRDPFFTVAEVMTFPPRVSWIWHHISCGIDGSSYWIEGERFNTPEKVIHWTLHLMEKNWFRFTDWRGVIERFYPECT